MNKAIYLLLCMMPYVVYGSEEKTFIKKIILHDGSYVTESNTGTITYYHSDNTLNTTLNDLLKQEQEDEQARLNRQKRKHLDSDHLHSLIESKDTPSLETWRAKLPTFPDKSDKNPPKFWCKDTVFVDNFRMEFFD